MNSRLLEYGKKVNSTELISIITHIFKVNNDLSHLGQKGTPICIWGTHGLGKTQIVRDFASSKKWKFAYVAPAQFEEMGDLHGMPTIVDPEVGIIGDEYTVYSPPDWVPREEGPGILLLDDINRADDRILRGCMQLLQNFELTSWKLPPKWQIVVTANPEGGDYSVTPMDGAMLTRMMHITLKFDAQQWAKWAYSANIDKRGISFVLTYPELVNSERTTPRSLTQFFEAIKTIDDLKENQPLVEALALSALDEITVSNFVLFVNDELIELIDPDEILGASDFTTIESKIESIAVDEYGAKRLDRLAVLCTRLLLKLTSEDYSIENNHPANLIRFLLMKSMPSDLLMGLYMDLKQHGSNEVKDLLRDEKLAKRLLSNL
jgi:MoxR-like ATPase